MSSSDATRRSWFGAGLVTYHSSSSLHKRGYLLQSNAPPPRCPLAIYPQSFSFPYKHLPSLVPGHQVSSSLHLSFCHSTVFVSMPMPLIGLVTPAGQSSIFPGQKLHIHPHTWQKPLSWGPHCCQWWGRKSRPGA